MNLSEEDLACLRAGVAAVFGHRPVKTYVVGSFARGEEVRSSDLDLMVKASAPLTLAEMGTLRDYFDQSDLPYILDLVDYHRVAPERLEVMLRDAKSI